MSSSEVNLDFGPLLLGQQADQQIQISNIGASPLSIVKLDTPGSGSGFQVGLSSPGPLQPGEPPLNLAVRFRPVAAGTTSAQVSLLTDCSGGALVLNVRGEGILPLLEVNPTALDFGKVLVGSQASRDLLVNNDSDATRTLTLLPLQGTDSALFRLWSAPPSQLAPHQQVKVTIAFKPAEVTRVPSRAAFAFALDCLGCQAQVDLTGQGVLTGLSVSPNPINFGAVLPPNSATAALVLANAANAPIALLAPPALVQPSPAVFQLGPAAPAGNAILQPGQTVLVPVVFTATGIGQHQATLDLTTDDPVQSNISVPIFATSGGPRIQCSPDAVDFGDVSVGIPALARVTCINVGVGNDSDPSTNLYLGLSTDSSDFGATFDLPPPLTGLFPGLPAKAVIDLGFTPASVGHELGHLVVTSNDPTTPELPIALQGSGVMLPPCVSDVQPAFLDFGQVARGITRDEQFVIANTGTVDCLVNGLDLSTDSSPAFSLPGGPIASQRLSPVGSSSGLPSQLTVTVRFAPALNHGSRYNPSSEGGSFSGQVQFTLSDPEAPQQGVPLSGLSPDDCLVFDPVTPVLGAVPYDPAHQRWCGASRTFTVTNVCYEDATLTAAYFDGGSGTLSISGPGGGAGPWTIPPLLGSDAGPVPFQLAFRPTAAGQEIAILELQSSQLFPNQTIAGFECGYGYVEIPLQVSAHEIGSGIGQPDGSQVDSFTGRGTQVDVLWIVDVMDSVTWQVAPGDLAPFLQYPLSNGIDFQMGVTSTSAVGAAPAPFVVQDFGYLEPCDHCWILGSTATIVGPGALPDPASVLSPLLSIGGLPSTVMTWDVDCPGFDDQFFESFTEALQPDLLTGHNAGFLRPNSVLAIVALGDFDNDESDGSFSFFYNFLSGLKGRDRVSFSFAGNPANDSLGDYANQLPGLMAQLTGGVVVDASQTGWMAQLAQVWTRIADELFRYPLTSPPADPTPYDPVAHPGGLNVQVNGQPIPSGGPMGLNWHYDGASNSVIFEPAAAPPAGASLTVSYALACQE